MKACEVDLGALRGSLTRYIDDELKELVIDEGGVPKWTAGFQRAVIQAQGVGRDTVTGAGLLVNIFAERESHAAYFLQEREMTRYDAVNYISHRIGKRIVKGS